MLQVVLVEPEIPQNTGNIARTCAVVGAKLHLVEPLGFHFTERNLKRSGCDYWDKVEIEKHASLQRFLERYGSEELHLFTGKTTKHYTDVSYSPDAFLVFGRESAGLSDKFIDAYADCCVRIPMREGLRSLNLSNAVAVGVYEACRQLGFSQLS